MTTYLARSAWTGTSARGSSLSLPSSGGVAVHYPGSGNVTYAGRSQSQVASLLRGWRNWHVSGRGWSDIGYNFAIDQAGRVWMLRSTSWAGNRVGAHSASTSNPSANRQRVGVLLVLGNNEKPSAAMIQAFRHWRHTRFLTHWSGRTDLRGHGQVPGASTSCPGTRVRALISNGTLAARPGGSTTPPPTSGGSMSWSEDLSRKSSGPKITEHADGILSDAAGRNAAQLLGYAGAALYEVRSSRFRSNIASAVIRAINPTLDLQYGTTWRLVFNAVRPDRSQTPGARVGFLVDLDEIKEQNQAIIAAVSGGSSAEVLERIDQHHAEQMQRADQAETSLQALVDANDLLLDHLAAIAEAVENPAELNAEQVVARLREMLHEMTAPADGDAES